MHCPVNGQKYELQSSSDLRGMASKADFVCALI